jgi:hypothetical protein
MDAHNNPATILPVDAGRNTDRARTPGRARLPVGRGSARAAAQTELRPTGASSYRASPYRIEIVELGQQRVTLGSASTLVHRLLNPLGFVAFKMGRLRGARKEHILDRYVTDEQRSSRPIFNATLRTAACWLFFRVARSTVMIQIAALRSRLEKQPTDLRRSPRDLGDGALESSAAKVDNWHTAPWCHPFA